MLYCYSCNELFFPGLFGWFGKHGKHKVYLVLGGELKELLKKDIESGGSTYCNRVI